MEAVGAVTYLMAGSDILIMRHPEAVKMVKAFIDLCSDGGSAADVAPITKELGDAKIDLAKISPKPDGQVDVIGRKGQVVNASISHHCVSFLS